LSHEDYINNIVENDRIYCLAIYDKNQRIDIDTGEFRSRIAKFSLTEFASNMISRELKFSICKIPL